MVITKEQDGRCRASRPQPAHSVDAPARWSRRPEGWNKLNIDGAFHVEDGTGGAGMILRSSEGNIIFSSRRFLHTCCSALEAEVAACAEGLALALEWSKEPFILESDCSVAVNMLKDGEPNRSLMAAMVEEAKLLLKSGREVVLLHVRRGQNPVAHTLAQMGRVSSRTAVWLRHGPDEISQLCQLH